VQPMPPVPLEQVLRWSTRASSGVCRDSGPRSRPQRIASGSDLRPLLRMSPCGREGAISCLRAQSRPHSLASVGRPLGRSGGRKNSSDGECEVRRRVEGESERETAFSEGCGVSQKPSTPLRSPLWLWRRLRSLLRLPEQAFRAI